MFVSAVISYSLFYAINVMDYDDLATILLVQIQISIVLIDMARNPSVELTAKTKQLGITLQKAQKTIQATTQRKIWTMLHTSLSR